MSVLIGFTSLPLRRKPCQEEPGHHYRDRLMSGSLRCTVQALTPVSIKSLFDRMRPTDQPFLPASSLKGMLRNTFQLLGAGCSRDYQGRDVPLALAECNESATCLTCRVFGFVNKEFAWSGKVQLTDTAPAPAQWESYHLPVDRPHTEGTSGWIVFRHGPIPQLSRGSVRYVAAGWRSSFHVHYLNLDAEELGLLRFALALKGDGFQLAHKLGYGKSLGFGSLLLTVAPAAPIAAEVQPYLDQPQFARFRQLRQI